MTLETFIIGYTIIAGLVLVSTSLLYFNPYSDDIKEIENIYDWFL